MGRNTKFFILILFLVASVLGYFNWKNVSQPEMPAPSPSLSPVSSPVIEAENILQIIAELTAPMVWSEPQPGIAYDGLGQKVTGVLIGTKIPADKADNKVIPLLGSNSPLITTYGWKLNSDESASGKDGEIVVFHQDKQKLIFRSGVFNGEYKYFVLLSNP